MATFGGVWELLLAGCSGFTPECLGDQVIPGMDAEQALCSCVSSYLGIGLLLTGC